jgi:hypothetical protein
MVRSSLQDGIGIQDAVAVSSGTNLNLPVVGHTVPESPDFISFIFVHNVTLYHTGLPLEAVVWMAPVGWRQLAGNAQRFPVPLHRSKKIFIPRPADFSTNSTKWFVNHSPSGLNRPEPMLR